MFSKDELTLKALGFDLFDFGKIIENFLRIFQDAVKENSKCLSDLRLSILEEYD